MQTRFDMRAAPVTGRHWLWLLAFLALPIAGCGDPEPETTVPSIETDTKRSANFVSVQPTAPITNPQWQQPQPPPPDFNRFSRYRPDPSVPTGNPWALPVPQNAAPAVRTPDHQSYANTPWGQAHPGSQPRTYRYRPLDEKEAREMQQQEHWIPENRYPNTQPNSPYTSPPPAQPSSTINRWENNRRWGSYPPTRNY